MNTIKKWFNVIKGDDNLKKLSTKVLFGLILILFTLFGGYKFVLTMLVIITILNEISIQQNKQISDLRDLNYVKKEDLKKLKDKLIGKINERL